MKRGTLAAVFSMVSAMALCAANGAPAPKPPLIDVDKGIVTKADSLKATLVMNESLKGNGKCHLIWTDAWGRTVADEMRDVQVDGTSVPLSLPLARSAGMDNFLEVELSVGDKSVKFPKSEFIVTPDHPWDDYQIVMYFGYPKPEQQRGLRDAGITAGQIQSFRTQSATGGKQWWEYDYQYYCDQIASSFYAAYHFPGMKPKGKALQTAKALYLKDRTKKDAFFRKPSLSDESALAEAVAKIKKAVESQMRFKPLFYAETDEGGVAELVAAWDFDFSPPALEAMRKWLMEQYGSLEGINKEWGTKFEKIEDVTPLSTDEMMARGDNNLSPWADHRFFMNKSFADDVAAGAKAGHEADKNALIGLVGCQMPSAFGGYDYWRLSQAMDCIEPYNIGNSREVWRSFANGKPAMTTAFGADDFEIWRLWYQALQGDQGIIIYDEKASYLDADGHPTKKALDVLPTYRELTGGLIKQMRHMTWERGPVLIHYSQPSITAHWMLEARPAGKAWVGRGSGSERKQSEFMRLRESWTKLVEDDQGQTNFVAYEQLEKGELANMGAKVLILPQSIAMSQKECQAVRDFVDAGGTVVADCQTALMDGHCRMLEKGQLDDLFGIERADTKFAPGPAGLRSVQTDRAGLLQWQNVTGAGAMEKVSTAEPGIKLTGGAIAFYRDTKNVPAVIYNQHGKGQTLYLNMVVTDYHRWRLKPPEGLPLANLLEAILRNAQAQPQYGVTADEKPTREVELFPYSSGDLKLLALHRNYQIRISELGPTEYQTQGELQKPLHATVDFGGEYAVYDSRAGKYLGKMKSIACDLEQWKPTIYALLPDEISFFKGSGPDHCARGEMLPVSMELIGGKLGDNHVFHVEVSGPDGKEIVALRQNVLAPKGKTALSLPMAVSDPAGKYKIEFRDAATGLKGQFEFTVN